MTEETLEQIRKERKHHYSKWKLDKKDHANLKGADLRRLNLDFVDLSGADLKGADLREASLEHADLSEANLSNADLTDANLYGAKLNHTDLIHAKLYRTQLGYVHMIHAYCNGASFINADMHDAIITESIFRNANLSHVVMLKTRGNHTIFNDVNLTGASITNSDLSYGCFDAANLREASIMDTNLVYTSFVMADLTDADFGIYSITYGANFRYAINVPHIPYACPSKGSFIGYKKAENRIVVLEIPEDARRSSATTKKCRCDKANVLSIERLDGTPSSLTEVRSNWNVNFIYRVGETVEEPRFDEDRWNECSKGIHFFIDREDAVNYL